MALRMLALAAFLTAPSVLADGWPDISKPPTVSGGDGANDAAAIIAVEDYAFVSDVPGARRNAQDWYAWLSKAHGVPSTRIHMRLDEEGTDIQIREAAKRAASQVKKGGTLWFVWIGHGAPAKDGSDGLLVGADASASASGIYGRSVARSEVAEILGAGSQERTVVVLDACFSGKSGSGDALVKGLQPLVPVSATVDDRVTMLTATQRDQFAGPLPGAARPAFSYLLLGALRGWGDADGDRRVTAGEATRYVRDVMLALVTDRTQEPELQGAGDGWVLSGGREAGPDLAQFVVGAAGADSSSSDASGSGGLSVGSSGDSGGLADQLAQLALAQKQREAAEAAAAEAARKERELLARLASEREEKLDQAQVAKRREVAQMWSSMAPIVERGGPEAKLAVEAFVKEYGSAKVWVEDNTGRYERAVGAPEVSKAQAWLGAYRDTGDTGGGAAGIEWVRIPGGSFKMGSNGGGSDEKPVHRVRVGSFEMSKTEVTFGQYQACVDAGACSAPHVSDGTCWVKQGGKWGKGKLPEDFQGADQPVVCVDWKQARTFAGWAGGRLPSEAEWEYAARSGGKDVKYPWGKQSASCSYAVMDDGGDGCDRDRTWSVCSKTAGNTEQGLCDMAGNVHEWVEDIYHSSYSGAPVDGSAWTSGGSDRVFRGGSWSNAAWALPAALRYRYVPSFRYDYLGFRLLRE